MVLSINDIYAANLRSIEAARETMLAAQTSRELLTCQIRMAELQAASVRLAYLVWAT